MHADGCSGTGQADNAEVSVRGSKPLMHALVRGQVHLIQRWNLLRHIPYANWLSHKDTHVMCVKTATRYTSVRQCMDLHTTMNASIRDVQCSHEMILTRMSFR